MSDVEEFETEAEAMEYQSEHWKEDIGILDSRMDGRMNHVKTSPTTSRHGLEGYDMHFKSVYLWERATKAIKGLGFEIVSMRTESYRDEADFLVQVRRTRPATARERRRIDEDHYLMERVDA